MKQRVVSIETTRKADHIPSAVLVYCWLDGAVVWVKHALRGWEVPGGKIEPGESPEEAAHREVREESGIRLAELRWVGEYGLVSPDDAQQTTYKWVFTGVVSDVESPMMTSEISDVRAFRPWITPDTLHQHREISYVMKDDAFVRLWPVVLATKSSGW